MVDDVALDFETGAGMSFFASAIGGAREDEHAPKTTGLGLTMMRLPWLLNANQPCGLRWDRPRGPHDRDVFGERRAFDVVSGLVVFVTVVRAALVAKARRAKEVGREGGGRPVKASREGAEEFGRRNGKAPGSCLGRRWLFCSRPKVDDGVIRRVAVVVGGGLEEGGALDGERREDGISA